MGWKTPDGSTPRATTSTAKGTAPARARRCVQASAFSALLATTIACGNSAPGPTGPTPPDPPPVPTTVVLVGAGDIADCSNDAGIHAEATAKLIDAVQGATVFAAGDLAYLHGSIDDFNNCYDRRWGRFKNRTRPSPGNHEYESLGAMPYFNYFGAAAGPSGAGFYSYDYGNWHIVSLNSNVAATPGSEQWVWLREDLQGSRGKCQLAYWHHPRFSSGPNGGGAMGDVWQVLMDFKVDVVVTGHDHLYERFAEQDGNGVPSPNGIREFVVGTGGATPYDFRGRVRNSERQISHTYGILKLTLHPDTYDWAFIDVAGATQDSGLGACH